MGFLSVGGGVEDMAGAGVGSVLLKMASVLKGGA